MVCYGSVAWCDALRWYLYIAVAGFVLLLVMYIVLPLHQEDLLCIRTEEFLVKLPGLLLQVVSEADDLYDEVNSLKHRLSYT